MKYIAFLCSIVFLTQFTGCFLATQKVFISDTPDNILPAIKTTISNLQWSYQPGPLNVTVISYLNTGYGYFPLESKIIENADFMVNKEGTNFANNTGTYGAIKLVPNDTGTDVEGTFATEAGDAVANARLILECSKQQLSLGKKIIQPFHNKLKPPLLFVALNTVSPILSASYLSKDNPLITPKYENYLYMQNGIGDVAMVAMILSGLLTQNKTDRDGFVYGGIAIGTIWRLLTLLNLTDIGDYNKIAHSPYNLRAIKIDYESPVK